MFLSVLLFISACVQTNNNTKAIADPKGTSSEHLKTENSIRDVVDHRAFRVYGDHLLPWGDNSRFMATTLRDGSLMPYHSNVRAEVVVDALNYMIDKVNDGETIFYDFYDEQQRKEDPAKAHTGFFFFKGEPGSPYAIICPGGGFSYVASLHEGFPLAVEINKKRI